MKWFDRENEFRAKELVEQHREFDRRTEELRKLGLYDGPPGITIPKQVAVTSVGESSSIKFSK